MLQHSLASSGIHLNGVIANTKRNAKTEPNTVDASICIIHIKSAASPFPHISCIPFDWHSWENIVLAFMSHSLSPSVSLSRSFSPSLSWPHPDSEFKLLTHTMQGLSQSNCVHWLRGAQLHSCIHPLPGLLFHKALITHSHMHALIHSCTHLLSLGFRWGCWVSDGPGGFQWNPSLWAGNLNISQITFL